MKGFFLLEEVELVPLELEIKELVRLGMLRLFLLPNVPMTPLLLNEVPELLNDCATATVVVPTTDLVVVTQEVDAVVSVVVAMVTVEQLRETEFCGWEPIERDLTVLSLVGVLTPENTGFTFVNSIELSLEFPLAKPEGGGGVTCDFDTESKCCEAILFISILSTFTTGIE